MDRRYAIPGILAIVAVIVLLVLAILQLGGDTSPVITPPTDWQAADPLGDLVACSGGEIVDPLDGTEPELAGYHSFREDAIRTFDLSFAAPFSRTDEDILIRIGFAGNAVRVSLPVGTAVVGADLTDQVELVGEFSEDDPVASAEVVSDTVVRIGIPAGPEVGQATVTVRLTGADHAATGQLCDEMYARIP